MIFCMDVDAVTEAGCRWLLEGPATGVGHDLSRLLAGETGNRALQLSGEI